MFFVLPIGVDFQARRYPVVTFSLMGICTFLYLCSLLLFFAQSGDEEANDWLIANLGLVPAHLRVLTWITYQFVHGGFFHLLGNMVYLFLFGACVEDTLGRWQFCLFYLVGGIVSGAAHVVLAGHHSADIPLVGASGAISACIGGFVLLLPKTRINFRYFFFLVFRLFTGEFWLPAWLVLSFWFLEDVAMAILTAGEGGVAFCAHVGGFLSGLGMMAVYLALKKARGGDAAETVPTTGHGPRRVVVATVAQAPTIYLSEGGNQIGPFTTGQVREMLTLGSVAAGAYYWRHGMAEWRSIAEFDPGAN